MKQLIFAFATLLITLPSFASEQTIRESFPKEKTAQSKELFQSLQSSGLKQKKSRGSYVLRAFDVTCKTDSKGNPGCAFSTQPSDEKGQSYQVRGGQAEKLSEILFGLPVTQGESGASASFIECRAYAMTEKDFSYECSVAIELDYAGP